MCLDPTGLSYVALAMAVAGAGVAYKTQSDTADNQEKAALQEADLKRSDNDRQAQQLAEQQAAEANALAARQREDTAAFDVIAGENGGGVTAQRTLATIGIKQNQDIKTLASNARNQSGELGYQRAAIGTQMGSKLASISQPSLAQLGRSIGSAASNYGASQNTIKASQAKTTQN